MQKNLNICFFENLIFLIIKTKKQKKVKIIPEKINVCNLKFLASEVNLQL